MPKFSVIIPSFNRANVLPRAIESILNQKTKDWELIVVDDGSTDETSKVILTYFDLPGFSYVYQENSGVSSARNFGASKAKGEWLIFLDSDDYFEPNTFSILSSLLEQDLNNSFYQFGFKKKYKNTISLNIPEQGGYFPKLSGSFILKKSTFDSIEGYDTRLKFSENTELFHRINLAGYKGKEIQQIIVNYTENSLGGSKNLQNMIDSNLIILEKHNATLSDQTKRLYHQVIGVNQLRFRRFSEARYHLLKAFSYEPWKLKTLVRFSISLLPWLAKKIYSEKVTSQ